MTRTCGVRGFPRGYLEFEPFNGWFHATLEDASDEEPAAAPVRFEDRRNDIHDRPPTVTAHL
jgi:hypothetical protein